MVWWAEQISCQPESPQETVASAQYVPRNWALGLW